MGSNSVPTLHYFENYVKNKDLFEHFIKEIKNIQQPRKTSVWFLANGEFIIHG